MEATKDYFFCGIGGSGMLPLALIVKAKGHRVSGSDRALDQGRTAQKFEFLGARGIALYPQDGSGVRREQTVVISAAVEDTVPDVVAARRTGAALITRAELLADLFNGAPLPIGIAGTSGKSTTTGMLGWILYCAGRNPTVMNGAIMKNFMTPDIPFASAMVGRGDAFVSEVDESDGSIANYRPRIAVVTNIALDHKSLEDLRVLFRDFVARSNIAVLNLDNPETTAMAAELASRQLRSFSLRDERAHLFATRFEPRQAGAAFDLQEMESGAREQHVELRVPGRHNVQNALAAITAAASCNVPLPEACEAIGSFTGLRRRYETVGTARGITVIDDFAHNPDKIAATLATAHEYPGRLLLLFQPHGFGPLRLMKHQLIEAFTIGMRAGDVLVMPDPVYFGGTTERSVTSKDISEGVAARGYVAQAIPDRAECGKMLLAEARAGDRIIVMGARDDTLATFATDLLQRIESREAV